MTFEPTDETTLSAAQQKALNLFLDNEWRCAYDLGARLDTLQSLAKRGFLQKRGENGYIFSPRTGTLFRITEKGKI